MSLPPRAPIAATRRRSTETRALIVAAATDCLRTRRVRDLRVEEVMEAAGPGLSRTLFYRHFDDLVALVLSIAAPAFDRLFGDEEALRTPEPEASLEDIFEHAFGVIVEIFVEHGPVIRAALDAATFSDSAEAAVRSYFERGFGFAEGVLRDLGVSSPEETARALVHMDVAYLVDCFGARPRVSPQVATATLASIWTARVTALATGR